MTAAISESNSSAGAPHPCNRQSRQRKSSIAGGTHEGAHVAGKTIDARSESPVEWNGLFGGIASSGDAERSTSKQSLMTSYPTHRPRYDRNSISSSRTF